MLVVALAHPLAMGPARAGVRSGPGLPMPMLGTLIGMGGCSPSISMLWHRSRTATPVRRDVLDGLLLLPCARIVIVASSRIASSSTRGR